MRHAIIAVLLLAVLAGPAIAGPFEDGRSAQNRGDYATALREFRMAAEQGDPVAQFDLGIMYETDQGVQKDLVQAYMWLSLAAAQGHVVVGVIRDEVAKRMTPAQIAEAQRLAREWKPQ